MTLIGLGTDIIEIDRIKRLVDKFQDRCLGLIYTQQEWDYCCKEQFNYPSLAACFAAKEAVSKAFGVGFGPELSWTSIAVRHNSRGKPEISLDERAQTFLKQLGGIFIHVSLSHCRTFAIATAIIES